MKFDIIDIVIHHWIEFKIVALFRFEILFNYYASLFEEDLLLNRREIYILPSTGRLPPTP